MKNITVHKVGEWYAAYRSRGKKAGYALKLARASVEAETETAAKLTALSPARRDWIAGFVDDFIRSEQVEALTAERDADFFNEPERADRCHCAAEYCGDGKTHAEVIGDWRDAFGYWLSEHKSNRWGAGAERFEAAVRAMFDHTELWHDFHGSLDAQIG